MARIRYIKPDFFTDEDLGCLPFHVRLGYQGLWCHADRAGRLEDRPKYLKSQIFPYDDVDMEEVLSTLSKNKTTFPEPFIERYEVNGRKYIQILKFSVHQKPHSTEKDSVIPAHGSTPLTVKPPLDNASATHGEGNGEGNGEGEGEWFDSEPDTPGSPAKDAGSPPPPRKRFTPPTLEEVQGYCEARGNRVDPVKFHAHYTANGWKVGKNPMKNWKAAVVTWERGP